MGGCPGVLETQNIPVRGFAGFRVDAKRHNQLREFSAWLVSIELWIWLATRLLLFIGSSFEASINRKSMLNVLIYW